ncbi:hypothetical protein [Natronorubrum sp. FCH18a]|uniref:hypothetical protein n=1 Tax=Natronorubrum sp. FCH18a TaxID=3447018 RepID=UPI003F50FE9E
MSRISTYYGGHLSVLIVITSDQIRSKRAVTVLTAENHRKRSTRVAETVERHEESSTDPAIPWQLANDLFGDLEEIDAKFGAGEAAVHRRHLERDEIVDRTGGIVGRIGSDPSSYQSVRH